MTKTVAFLALLSLLLLLLLSLFAPQSPIMWPASASQTFTWVRAILIALLTLLILTNAFWPPFLHKLVGLFAVGVIVWALRSTYQNVMDILDGWSFLAGGVALGLGALESSDHAIKLNFGISHFAAAMLKRQLAIYASVAFSLARALSLNHSLHTQMHGKHQLRRLST